MSDITVITAFFLQPSDTLGGQAEEVVDTAESDRYKERLRQELGLNDANVFLFREGDWNTPSIETEHDLKDEKVFAEFIGRAAVELDQLGVADTVVTAFSKSNFEVLSLPASGRVILFQPITAPESELGGLIEQTYSGSVDPEFGEEAISEGLENYLATLDGSDEAASLAKEGWSQDQHSTWPLAMLADLSARYLALHPPESRPAMYRAWSSSVNRFMFDHCKWFTDGLHLTMDDPKTSLANLSVRLCFKTFETNRLDADAVGLIRSALDTLESETGREHRTEITQLREKLKTDVSKSCFIATAVYGDVNAHEVESLRGFRDQFISNYKLGKIFIKQYYRYSPRIALLVKQRPFLKYPLRLVLNLIIKLVSPYLRQSRNSQR